MVTTVTKNKRPLSLAEQQRNLALLECLAHPEQIIDRSRPLPASIADHLEQTINLLGSLVVDDHLRR